MSGNLAKEARRVFYSGHVQGVGFRYTARRIAQAFAVTGFVRNLSDGRVELFAEGLRDELNSLLAAIGETMADCIRNTQVHVEPASGKHDSFEIATDH
jgi:acylphosphatase